MGEARARVWSACREGLKKNGERAQGDGVVREHRGLDALLRQYGDHVASIELTPLGEPRRDWRKVVVGDGWIVIRHPELQQCLEISERFVSDLKIVAE